MTVHQYQLSWLDSNNTKFMELCSSSIYCLWNEADVDNSGVRLSALITFVASCQPTEMKAFHNRHHTLGHINTSEAAHIRPTSQPNEIISHHTSTAPQRTTLLHPCCKQCCDELSFLLLYEFGHIPVHWPWRTRFESGLGYFQPIVLAY